MASRILIVYELHPEIITLEPVLSSTNTGSHESGTALNDGSRWLQ
jgi:hypothetical protein